METHFLKSGEYFISNKDILISTVLGSCVSIFLFDDINKIIAVNHFLLPIKTKYINNNINEMNYGDNNSNIMLESMLKNGANKNLIKAKIYGGSCQFKNNDIGLKNVELAKDFLNKKNIEIIENISGGEFGRFITINSKDFSVNIKNLNN